ncbi:hypothetical protein [Microbacterium testaceum]|uniref:hypothetical protein n=1 Tax=Microbacterium testaceum TaxID=2033 RepID=UPI0012486FD5|nr:hypothetical protein [Microbacterium testaceum]
MAPSSGTPLAPLADDGATPRLTAVRRPTRGPHDRLLGWLSAGLGVAISTILVTHWWRVEGWADEAQVVDPPLPPFLEIVALVGPGTVLVIGGLLTALRHDARR